MVSKPAGRSHRCLSQRKKCEEKIMHKLKLHEKADGADDLC